MSKSRKRAKKKAFSATTLTSIIFSARSLYNIILDDSNRPIRIVQMNVLHVIYIGIVIEKIDVKVVYEIYPRVYTSRHHGSYIFQVYRKPLTFVFSRSR